MKRILVTGANGFVGSGLCQRLMSEKCRVTAALRRPVTPVRPKCIKTVTLGHVDGRTDWRQAIEGIDTVVHLAARVHVMTGNGPNPGEAYRQVNVDGTRNLADHAARAGVRRFVYLSSVKVNGEERLSAYLEDDDPKPEDAYGISKLEAERQLKAIAGKSGMEYVIIRPPLVYGPAVKANFLAAARDGNS